MVENMQQAGLKVEPFFVKDSDLDGKVFTSTGHSLGNRSKMMLQYGQKYLNPDSDDYFERPTETDFELREEIVYPTSDGRYIISYEEGIPAIRFESSAAAN
ncbi:MAG: hypothetical protein R3C11_22365 [Planctomycetaceae bacterium]